MSKQNISLSSSFLNRTKCKYCLSSPMYYFYTFKRSLNSDISCRVIEMKRFQSYIKRYGIVEKLYDLRGKKVPHFNPYYKSYNPKLYRNKVDSSVKTEHAICDCGETLWSFTYRVVKDRPEIINRKCRLVLDAVIDY